MRRSPCLASALRSESASGPASTSIALPLSRTRTASPCPTSRTVTVHRRIGAGPRATTTVPHSIASMKLLTEALPAGSGHRTQTAQARPAVTTAAATPAETATAAPGTRARPAANHAVPANTVAAAFIPNALRAGTAPPATAPARPASMATETSGPTIALASGASNETVPKAAATTGTVTACATRVNPIAPPAAAATVLTPGLVHAVARPPNKSSPRTASAESWKPRSNTAHGSMARSAMTATDSDARPSPLRPTSCPAPTTQSISRDRSAEYGRPVTTA